jgi:hypothetical protein
LSIAAATSSALSARKAPPGAEIDIGIGKANPALDVGGVFIGAGVLVIKAASTWIFVVEEEGSVAAIFAGQVEPEIVTGVVAETDAE